MTPAAEWYLVCAWEGAATDRRRSRFILRCAACLGGVTEPIIAAPLDFTAEAAWNAAACARCGRRVEDRRMLAFLERVGGNR